MKKKKTVVKILNSDENDILFAVAKLHKDSINQGFLPSLGEEFLFCIYKSILLSKNGFLAVYIEGNKVIGFISGTTDLQEVKSILRRKCKLSLFKVLIKLIFQPAKIKKFLETKNYSDKKDEIEAELLSIAVDVDYRGKGIAKKLYSELCKHFHNKGVKRFKIIVGENLIEAQKFYEKMGAKKEKEIELHKGQKSYLYIQEVDKCLQ